MKIILAPDSFKESLSAMEVCRAMAIGIQRVAPDAEIIELPLADGGEGTIQALIHATHGSMNTVQVIGPCGESISASWGILGDGRTAVIEMAQAAGLSL
ncbi:MAG: glycerate kinase, partial [Calditrichaeota bacterium]